MMTLLSRRGDSNTRPLRPERSALPTALLLGFASLFSKAAAKVLLFFDIRKFFCIFFAKSAILYVKKQILCLYREPGSNRHAHHWAKDFKSFLSTYSNIAAVEIGCKGTAFF